LLFSSFNFRVKSGPGRKYRHPVPSLLTGAGGKPFLVPALSGVASPDPGKAWPDRRRRSGGLLVGLP